MDLAEFKYFSNLHCISLLLKGEMGAVAARGVNPLHSHETLKRTNHVNKQSVLKDYIYICYPHQ